MADISIRANAGPAVLNEEVAGRGTLRAAEEELRELRRDEAGLKVRARAIFGVVGRRERIPFGPALEASGGGWLPLGALWLLALADASAGSTLVFVAPQVQLSLGPGTLGTFELLRPVLLMVGGMGALWALRWFSNRARVARYAAVASGVALAGAAVSTSTLGITFESLAIAGASGVSAAVILPLLMDTQRPELRVRAVGGFVAVTMAGIGGSALIADVAGGIGLTWRAAMLVVAIVAWGAAAAAGRIPEIRAGCRDRGRVEHLVQSHLGGAGSGTMELSDLDVALSTAEQFRRVLAPKSAGPLLAAVATFGIFAWGLPPYLSIFLRDRWDLVAPGRSLALSLLFVLSVPGLTWAAARAELALRSSPRRLVTLMASAATLAAVTLAASAAVPVFGLVVVLLAAMFTAIAALLLAAAQLLLTLCEPAQRGHASVLVGAAVLVGGLLGQLILSTAGSQFGVEWALIVVAVVPLGVAEGLRRAIVTVDADLDVLLGRIIEVQELRTRVAQGRHLPLLSCRHVDFSYGQVQVLFNVSFNVDDGEMVALLGTNGSGKTTMLRVISGLGMPSAGSIHYRGADVTFLGADRRVGLGISQIPGGRAVFGPLSVVENLRAYGHLYGRNRSRLERAIEETFAVLPKLAERRNQLASTLSGGEQQMLGLGKAFILRPRILLIDELSLGLAPIIVGELLDMVRRVNEEGTAVVMVEQSVNIALSLVDHAYFMEKGEIRFDGAAAELLERPDLLRSVFLHGATDGIVITEAART